MTAYLTHLSESRLEQLRAAVDENVERYRSDGFADLSEEPGWAIDLSQKIDISRLSELDGSDNRSETDLKDSILIADILKDMNPSIANEERIWVRLSHVEAIEYSRRRWLRTPGSDQETSKAVRLHFFARTHTSLRDDQALSRLWWNGYVARHCFPEDPRRGLELLLSSADVRANLVERVWLTGRRKLAGGVFRAMDRDPFVLESELSFREFMKSVNVLGAGVVFEAMRDEDIDSYIDRCSDDAQTRVRAAA